MPLRTKVAKGLSGVVKNSEFFKEYICWLFNIIKASLLSCDPAWNKADQVQECQDIKTTGQERRQVYSHHWVTKPKMPNCNHSKKEDPVAWN